LYEEILTKLNHLLDSYKEDYNIETTYSYAVSDVNVVSVNIKSKNSYISNLLSKDSHVVQNNKVLQAI
jgi:homoserine dehydrogenase